MIRRPPSLHRVAVDCRYPCFAGRLRLLKAAPSLRYYSDAKTSRHPSRRSFVSFAAAVPRLRRAVSLPRGAPTLATGPGVLDWSGHPLTPLLGPWKWLDLPSSRTGPFAAPLMLLRPRTDRTKLTVSLRPTRPRVRERPWLSRWTFEAQSHGLMARCLRFKAPGRPGTMQDSLPIARLRSIGWVSHPQGLL